MDKSLSRSLASEILINFKKHLRFLTIIFYKYIFLRKSQYILQKKHKVLQLGDFLNLKFSLQKRKPAHQKKYY